MVLSKDHEYSVFFKEKNASDFSLEVSLETPSEIVYEISSETVQTIHRFTYEKFHNILLEKPQEASFINNLEKS